MTFSRQFPPAVVNKQRCRVGSAGTYRAPAMSRLGTNASFVGMDQNDDPYMAVQVYENGRRMRVRCPKRRWQPFRGITYLTRKEMVRVYDGLWAESQHRNMLISGL